MENFMCRLCDVFYSSPEAYKQHIEGAKHKKKKNLQAAILDFVKPSTNIVGGAMSSICNPNQPMPNSEIQEPNDTRPSFCTSNISVNDGENDTLIVNFHDQQPLNLRIQELLNPMQSNPEMNFFFCQICDVRCSGFLPYKQHVSGKSHMKKSKSLNVSSACADSNLLQNATSTVSSSTSTSGTDFTDSGHQQFMKSCAIDVGTTSTGPDQQSQDILAKKLHQMKAFYQCNSLPMFNVCKTCPTQSSNNSNLNSGSGGTPDGTTNEVAQSSTDETPKPDIRNATSSLISNSPVAEVTSTTSAKNTYPKNFVCDICNIFCTGSEQYDQHIIGKLHKKKAARKGITCPKDSGAGQLGSSSSIPAKNVLLHLGVKVFEPDDKIILDNI